MNQFVFGCFMKKILGVLFMGISAFAESNVDYAENDDTFIELSDPSRYISGAFLGLGGGASSVSHKLTAHNESTNQDHRIKKSATQYDLSFLLGFGSLFHRNYYAGIQFEIMKRCGKGSSYDENLGFKFNPQFGINMDVRFGYLFPRQGNLAYATIGFSRTLGKVLFKTSDRDVEVGFGSYYPTLGLGFEHKINHLWNVGACLKHSITSKDSGEARADGQRWNYRVKPWVMMLKFYVTRNF